MSDTTYHVETVYTTRTGQAAQGIAGLQEHMRRTGSVADSLKDTVSSLFRVAAGVTVGAAVGGFALLRSQVIGLNADVETAQNTIAGMAQSGGVARNWQEATSFAADQMDRIRRDSDALPGSAEEYLQVFQTGFSAAIDSGMRRADVAPFTNAFTAVARSFGLEAGQAGRELDMILRGRAGSHVVAWSRIVQSQVHMTAQEWNSMSSERRLAAMRRIFNTSGGPFTQMIEAAGHTWDGVFGTTKGIVRELSRHATLPLFNHVRETLEHFNTWFGKNRGRFLAFADELGAKLAAAFDHLVRLIQPLKSLFESGRSIGGTLAHGVRGAMGPLAGMGLARGALGLMGNSGAMTAVGGMFGGGALAGGLATGAIALPLILALTSGAADVQQSVAALDSAFQSAMDAAVRLWHSIEPLILVIGQLQMSAIQGLIEAVTPVIRMFGDLVTAISDATSAIANSLPTWLRDTFARVDLGSIFRETFRTIIATLPGGAAVLAASDFWSTHRPQERMMADFEDRRMPFQASIGSTQLALARDRASNNPRQPAAPGRMNVTVRIEQTINDASDPSRVFVDTRRAIQAGVWHPIESPGAVYTR